jgi:acyl CoA:acetate/3-ketoacid CoA transferase alpha subunit
MAMAGDTVIACVEKRVEDIDPEHVITPHPFIDYLVEVS